MYTLASEQPDRSKLLDTRVHACLYFIQPTCHSLLPLDIKMMAELCKRVNLIPVIAKADSLTVKERIKFKYIVRKAIRDNNIHPFIPDGYPTWDDNNRDYDDRDMMSDSEESEPTKLEPTLPFAIISSEDAVGWRARVREYRWGIAEVENSFHCDFDNLNKVLMSENMLDLIQTTIDEHYERYRQGLLLRRINWHNQKLRRVDSENCGNILDVQHDHSGLVAGHGVDTEPKVDIAVSESGGLEALMAIQSFGYEYIRRRALGMAEEAAKSERTGGNTKAVYELVVKSERDRLEDWNQALMQKRKSFENELHTIHNGNHRLISQINEMGFSEVCNACEKERKRLVSSNGTVQVL
jgi:septin family protein